MKLEGMVYNEHRCKTSLTKFLNKIRFFYIPAIKDDKIFEEMLLCLRETIYNDKLAADKKLQKILNDTANKVGQAANDLNDEFYQVTGIESEIIPPNSVAEIYNTLKISTKTENGRVSILDRGDGIRVRYIPSILNYIAKNTRNICIWGYEEPENSLEYNLALKMAEDFMKYSIDGQVFITTHSPAFIGLENDQVKLYRCYKNNGNTVALDIADAEQQDDLREELGYLKLLTEQNSYYKKKVLELESMKRESEILKKELENTKKPILMTEGKTDVDILMNAWKRLYGFECPFIIKSCNTYPEESETSAAGCTMLANTLISWKYDATSTLIGLFDNDTDGLKAFDLGNNFEEYKSNIKRHKNGNVYAMVLPATDELKEFEKHKNLCIEFYFDLESLNTKVDGFGLELSAQPIIEKCGSDVISEKTPDINTQLFYYKPTKSTKTYFAEKVVPSLPDEKFDNFKILFEKILEILNLENDRNKIKDECATTMENISGQI